MFLPGLGSSVHRKEHICVGLLLKAKDLSQLRISSFGLLNVLYVIKIPGHIEIILQVFFQQIISLKGGIRINTTKVMNDVFSAGRVFHIILQRILKFAALIVVISEFTLQFILVCACKMLKAHQLDLIHSLSEHRVFPRFQEFLHCKGSGYRSVGIHRVSEPDLIAFHTYDGTVMTGQEHGYGTSGFGYQVTDFLIQKLDQFEFACMIQFIPHIRIVCCHGKSDVSYTGILHLGKHRIGSHDQASCLSVGLKALLKSTYFPVNTFISVRVLFLEFQ